MVEEHDRQSNPSIAFVSLGCPKNLVDSERMLGLLAQDGLTVTADRQQADAIVINTCGFLEASKTESLQEIRRGDRTEDNGKMPARGRGRLPGAAAQDQTAGRRSGDRSAGGCLRPRAHRSGRARARRIRGRSMGIIWASITICLPTDSRCRGCRSRMPGRRHEARNEN